MNKKRKHRIDTVSMFIPVDEETPYRNAADIADDINRAGILNHRNLPWETRDVYRAVRELRASYPEYGVSSLPSIGYHFESDPNSENVKKSRQWIAKTACSQLRSMHTGLVLPLASSEAEREFLEKAFKRMEEDIMSMSR